MLGQTLLLVLTGVIASFGSLMIFILNDIRKTQKEQGKTMQDFMVRVERDFVTHRQLREYLENTFRD